MGNTKDNRRARYSMQVIEESLIELMNDKPVGRISVTELCQKADVNRSTFYLHYTDAFDCLKKIEDDLYAELVDSVASDIVMNGAVKSMAPVFQVVARNRDRFLAIFGRFGDPAFLDRCFDIGRAETIELLSGIYADKDAALLESMRLFVINGCLGIIREWAYGGMKEDVGELAKLADQMSIGALGL